MSSPPQFSAVRKDEPFLLNLAKAEVLIEHTPPPEPVRTCLNVYVEDGWAKLNLTLLNVREDVVDVCLLLQESPVGHKSVYCCSLSETGLGWFGSSCGIA